MENVHTPKRVAAQPGRRRKIALIAAGCAAAVLLAAYLGLCAWVGGSPNILKGVSVAGVPVGGLTREQALETLEDNLGQVSSVTLPLEYGPWEGEITAAAVRVDDQATVAQAWQTGRENFLLQGGSYLAHLLGAEDEIGLTLAWTDDGKSELEKKMDEADLQVGGALTNATYAMEGDKLLLTKGVTGVTIDRETLEVSDHVVGVDFDVNQAKTLFDAAAEGETVEIPLTITQPEETKEGLEGKLFRDLLGEGTSRVGGSANRKSNVKLSAQACNGVVLMPGEVFSYNNTTGSRTADKGYLGAPVYSGGASVEGIGGGICQTSSTIYYAVLHTTLEIVERHAHMYAVEYVPDGMDATVWYGSSDFRFKNNTNYPVKVVTESYDKNGSRYLTVKIYGTNEDGRYAVPQRTQYDWITPTTQYKADSSVPRGTTRVDSVQNAYRGRKAQTYRYIYAEDGTLLEKQDMGVSSYKMRPTTILYNPADGDPSQPASKPETPTVPETPEVPETPTTPETPSTPETPVTPEEPQQPTQPETPATTPEEPAQPETPEVPETPPSQDIQA